MFGNEWRDEGFSPRQDSRIPKRPVDKQLEDHFHYCNVCQDYMFNAQTCSVKLRYESRVCSGCGE